MSKQKTIIERKNLIISKKDPLVLGDLLPDVKLDYDGIRTLKCHITDHIIVVLISTSCGACESTLEALYEYTKTTTDANIVLFINSNNQSYQKVKKIFDSSVEVYNVPLEIMLNEFQTSFLPLGIAADRNGRITAIQAFNNKSELERIVLTIR